MATAFDVIVIGSGPGGYTAAIRASQLGFKTAIVEKYAVLGGTCTNVGCIPSKALLDGTEVYDTVIHQSAKNGISFDGLRFDFSELMKRKVGVVKQNTDGLNYLMRKNKIAVINGVASFLNNKEIAVRSKDGAVATYTALHFIIATGSKPSSIPGVSIDKDRIITSTEALSLKRQPGSIVIIGGGVIGVEMASVFNRIGTEVSIYEYADRLIPVMDKDLSRELEKLLSAKGIKIHLKTAVQKAINNGDSVTLEFKDSNGNIQHATGEYCLVATGRYPYTKGLGLETTKISLNPKGFITTNKNLQTDEENIYAIGDVVAGAMLAHKAEDEAILVASVIAGQQHHVDYLKIPNVVYTWPEVAAVGLTEEELIAQKIEYNKGKFPFSANAKARAAAETSGFVKVLADKKYGEILGVHVIGARAADLIAQAVLAMEFEITDNEMGRISYAHPTFSEAFKDAYLMASGRGAINI
jgi:dihydrolipoamide dehydrogenase